MEKEDIPSADSYFSHPRRIFYTIKRCPHHITPQNSPSPLATGAFSANGIKKPCRLCYKTGRDRMLTKWADWQSVEKARRQGHFASGKICRRRRLDLTIPKGSANPPQGSKLASKGAYIDVSDRRMQVLLTQEAKIAPDFYFIRAIFAVVGFVSALTLPALLQNRQGSGNLRELGYNYTMHQRVHDYIISVEFFAAPCCLDFCALGHALCLIPLIERVAALGAEFRRVRRVGRLPAALIAAIDRRSCRTLCTALGAELTGIDRAAGACPAGRRFGLGLFRAAFGAEFTGSRRAANACPRVCVLLHGCALL